MAVIFGIAIIPIMSAVGSAVDYSLVTRMKAKLQSAADAAAVASISQNSVGYNAAVQMTGNGRISAAEGDAAAVFNGNVNGITGYKNLSISNTTVTKTGVKLNANVQFSADVPVVFLQVLGYSKLSISGASSASASLPPYLDYYLMLDVSGSMGLPSTAAEQTRLAAVNPDNFVQYPTGCTLACHFAVTKVCNDDHNVTPPTNYPLNPPTNSPWSQKYSTNDLCMGYQYTRVSQNALKALVNADQNHVPGAPTGTAVPKQVPGLPVAMLNAGTNKNGFPNSLVLGNPNSLPYSLPSVASCPTDGTDACIQLRADAVGTALTQLFQAANQFELVTNQFRIGLYPFVQKLFTYFPLTSSINGSPTNSSTINYAAANLATLLDTNTNSNLGSGGTHLDTAFQNMNNIITSVGDGSSAVNTQPFVFLVTDGAQDNQTKALNQSGGWSGSNHATVMPVDSSGHPIDCKKLTDRGIIVSVLYIPYAPIQNPNPSFAGDEDDAANNNIVNIEPNLQACASPGFYFSASTPQGISDSLQAMFKKSLQTAHIIN